MADKKTVALVFGGRSGEHGISCVTAGGILSAIDRERYDVVAIGITPTGRFVEVEADPAYWQLTPEGAPVVDESGDEILLPAKTHHPGEKMQLRVIKNQHVETLAEVDVFFPLLHGPYGEDGTIQGLFDLFDLPYVGAGVLASAVCQDKHFTKVLLAAAGLNVAPGITVHERDYLQHQEQIKAEVAELGLPLFVKPARAGSSLGVSRVTDLDQLDTALAEAFACDPRVLIESGVEGREVECGVLEDVATGEVKTTLPGEVKIGDDLDFYDYESKYFGKGTVNIEVPANLSESQQAAVRSVAAQAFKALGLEGLSRVDVFVTADKVVVNEVNTMPGFTPFSMYPVLWQNMGITYTELLSKLIEAALTRKVGLR